ncbi:hypothetical protein ES703_110598 [subsurface metagenome]
MGEYNWWKNMGNFELNQILAYEFRNPEVAIGSDLAYTDNEIEIFDPELALIGKLDKIPIMRGLVIVLESIPDLAATLMNDTGNNEMKWLLQLFNDNNYNDPENPGGTYDWNGKKPNLIGMASKWAYTQLLVGGGVEEVVDIETINFSMQYQGGIPLKPKLLFRNELGFSNNVAGAKWGIGTAGHGKIFIEIDWSPISKKDFDEYIREYIYVQE